MDLVAWAAGEAKRRLSPLGARWAHTRGTAAQARALATLVPEADRDVLVAAAFMHDIGYDPELVATRFHPLDGAGWLRAEGHERLACLVAHHSGARFEARLLGLAHALDEFPEEHSATADTLSYCDLTTDPSGRTVAPHERLTETRGRHGPDSVVTRGIDAAEESLAAIVARTETRLARARSARQL
jgi:hypothetical protein